MSFEDGVCLKKKGSSNGQRFLISTNDIGPMLKAPLSNLSKIVPLACLALEVWQRLQVHLKVKGRNFL